MAGMTRPCVQLVARVLATGTPVVAATGRGTAGRKLPTFLAPTFG